MRGNAKIRRLTTGIVCIAAGLAMIVLVCMLQDGLAWCDAPYLCGLGAGLVACGIEILCLFRSPPRRSVFIGFTVAAAVAISIGTAWFLGLRFGPTAEGLLFYAFVMLSVYIFLPLTGFAGWMLAGIALGVGLGQKPVAETAQPRDPLASDDAENVAASENN